MTTVSIASPTPARILVVGGGGRENALAWALARSHGVEQVWVAPGNGGTLELEGCQQLAIAESNQAGLLAACRELAVELVVVGPEAPLAAGLAGVSAWFWPLWALAAAGMVRGAWQLRSPDLPRSAYGRHFSQQVWLGSLLLLALVLGRWP